MRKFIIIFIFLLLTSISSYAEIIASNSPQLVYEQLFSAEQTQKAQFFSEEFLAAVPEAKINEIISLYLQTLGAFKGSRKTDNGYMVEFENGETRSTIAINQDQKIAGLWFGAPEIRNDTLESVRKSFLELSGKVSICLLKHEKDGKGNEILALDHHKPMAVGSAFKLCLLQAIEEEIIKGNLKWSDTVALKDAWKSFPSGIMHEWPEGSVHTIETMAGLMISLSDNTATDHIFNMLGHEKIRKFFPETCVDLYNTSQVLKLKFFFPEKAKEFAAAGKEKKQLILNEMDNIAPSQIASISAIYSANKPFLIEEIEWFISTLDLCEIIYSLRENRLCRINPATGLIDPKDWHQIGFKGGSEPGVLNYTWVLQKTAESPVFTLSCTINDTAKPVDSNFDMVVSRLLKVVSTMN